MELLQHVGPAGMALEGVLDLPQRQLQVLLPAGAQKYGLAQDIEVDPHGLVHAFEGPGLGAAIDFPLIERKKVAVLS